MKLYFNLWLAENKRRGWGNGYSMASWLTLHQIECYRSQFLRSIEHAHTKGAIKRGPSKGDTTMSQASCYYPIDTEETA